MLANGDIFKGNFKDGQRYGQGLCKFTSGAIYKGEWRDDQPDGFGMLFSGNNELIEGKFEKGYLNGSTPSSFLKNPMKIRMVMSDGSFYQGLYVENERHGKGVQIYPNGDMYDGMWHEDQRAGAGRFVQTDGAKFEGKFEDDKAVTKSGQESPFIEDKYHSVFRTLVDKDKNGWSGCLLGCRLQGKCSIEFENGNKFIGIFKDGRPNGLGEMSYKNSIPL